MPPINLLINLPPAFFATGATAAVLKRAAALGRVRRRSHDTPDAIRRDLAWADAVLMWSWPALDDALLDAAPRLRFSGQIDITRAAAEVALRRGLAVSTARRCWSPAVAEMALALILNGLRRVSAYHGAMAAGTERWIADFPGDIDPRERELTGRRVGIIGFGAVGRRLGELLAPFRCELMVHDPYLPAEVAAGAGATAAGLPDLLRACDVVVLCAASNTGTQRLLGKRQIAMLRRDALLVNVARAALVDTAALVARLGRGDLHACIDVFDQEPLGAKHPLRRAPNCWLTPHRAGGILPSVERALTWLLDDLEAHLAGRGPRFPLTAAMLPGLDG
jgi:phosphoglycerate dehydrogenase-like enzyme